MPVTTEPPATAAAASPLEWVAFERLLADLAAGFAAAAQPALDAEIEAAMARLIDFLGFDRSSYVLVQADDDGLEVIAFAARGSLPALPRGRLAYSFSGSMARLRAGRVLRLSNLPEACRPRPRRNVPLRARTACGRS